MFLTFFCNYLNHHQVWVADELHNSLGDQFCFVVTLPSNPSFMKGGLDYSKLRDYCLVASDGEMEYKRAIEMAKKGN